MERDDGTHVNIFRKEIRRETKVMRFKIFFLLQT